MAERNAAAGYLALGKQPNAITPVTPTILAPYYKQTLETNLNLIQDQPVYGNKFEILQNLQSTRSHKGGLTVMAEPFTAMYWLDMILTLLNTSNASGVYTRTFGVSNQIDPNFYTLDLNLVSQVIRFFGYGSSKMGMPFADGEMQFDITGSALGSFYGREIASVAGQVITLTTTYDPNPTTGLVVGDLVAAKSTDGTRNVNTLVVTALTGTTVTVTGTITSVQAGDMFVLRPNTSLQLLTQTPFLWPLTQYKYGATLTAALAAAQTRLEDGTLVELSHKFQNDDGENRSGGFDPASLIRTTAMYNFKTKQYFDNPDQFKIFHAVSKQAASAQSTSGANGLLRADMNSFAITKEGMPTQFGDTIYQELEYGPEYNRTDGQGMLITLSNGSATM